MAIHFDKERNAWIFDDVTEATGGAFNNLLKWGQPYSPYEAGRFRHDVYDAGLDGLPTVVFDSKDVLTNGFGQNVQLSDFDVVKNLQIKKTGLKDGSYTLKQLQTKGLSKTGLRGDHVIGTNLYLNQSRLGVSAELGSDDAAYVFGSVLFQLSDDTVFTFKDGHLTRAKGRIGLQEDNFDHESTTIPSALSVGIPAAVGDEQNYDQVRMLFEGPGKELTFGSFDSQTSIQEEKRNNLNIPPNRPPPRQWNPAMYRLLSGDPKALDPENGPFSPNLLRMLMGGKVPRVSGASRLEDIARPNRLRGSPVYPSPHNRFTPRSSQVR